MISNNFLSLSRRAAKIKVPSNAISSTAAGTGGGIYATPDSLKKLQILRYNYIDNMAEKRAPYRQSHILHIQSYSSKNKIKMAGAVGNAVEGLFIFNENVSKEEITSFLKNDPYFQNNLVAQYSISDYTVVSGTNFDEIITPPVSKL